MSLFAFYPNGHGERSFFVIAESLEQAVEFVSLYVKTLHPSEYSGWGTDYYRVEVAAPGEVLYNTNE